MALHATHTMQVRYHTSPIELRAEESGRVGSSSSGPGLVVGTAIRYNEIAPKIKERIEAGAFGDIGASRPVFSYLQHQRSQLLGKTGANLVLRDSDDRLDFELALPDTQLGRDTATMVRSGILAAASIGFMPTSETRDAMGNYIVKRADLIEVSLVDSGAYPSAKSSLSRSRGNRNDERRARRLVL